MKQGSGHRQEGAGRWAPHHQPMRYLWAGPAAGSPLLQTIMSARIERPVHVGGPPGRPSDWVIRPVHFHGFEGLSTTKGFLADSPSSAASGTNGASLFIPEDTTTRPMDTLLCGSTIGQTKPLKSSTNSLSSQAVAEKIYRKVLVKSQSLCPRVPLLMLFEGTTTLRSGRH